MLRSQSVWPLQYAVGVTVLWNFLMVVIDIFSECQHIIRADLTLFRAVVLLRVSARGAARIYQWFPKWAVLPPGGRWDYRRGR
jgi:hypothetical protein